jgi:hypothetical protein
VKTLLVAASALVIGLSSQAFADNSNGHNQDPRNNPTVQVNTAVALNDQDAAVAFAFAKGTDAANAIAGTMNMTGLQNVQQNGGANSVLQDGNTLGAILNCSCSSGSNGNTFNTSLASNDQDALVLGAVSIGASNKAGGGSFSSSSSSHSSGFLLAAGGEKSSGGHDSRDGGSQSAGFILAAGGDSSSHDSEHGSFWYASQAVQSTNSINGNITTLGLTNISQNVGNNSVLQSSNTVAAIVGK